MKQCIPKLNLIVLYYQISVDIFLLVKLDDDYSQTVNYRIDFHDILQAVRCVPMSSKYKLKSPYKTKEHER